MLSLRGKAFAESGLYDQYGREKTREPYDRISNPNGEVSFLNAENVGDPSD
jgi:hypothetical protein